MKSAKKLFDMLETYLEILEGRPVAVTGDRKNGEYCRNSKLDGVVLELERKIDEELNQLFADVKLPSSLP